MKKKYLFYLLAVCIGFLFLFYILDLKNSKLDVPFWNSGDARLSQYYIKTIIDNGWYFSNEYTGAPGKSELLDYPVGADNLHFIIIKALGWLTKNTGTTINLFYLLSFFLIITSSYFVLHSLGVLSSISVVVSILYAFLPFHFLRGESHLFLSSYFCIPIVVYFLFWIYGFLGEKLKLSKRIILFIFLLGIIGSTGIYYAYFALFFFLIAGISSFTRTKEKDGLIKTIFCVIVVFITVLINMAPSLFFQVANGKNTVIASRNYMEAEYYGLKLTQLLIPQYGHRFVLFSRAASKFKQFLNSEGSNFLGSMGSLGFVVLFLFIFPFHKLNDSKKMAEIKAFSELNIFAILLATIGGFSSLIAFLFFDSIRAYNRISVYVAYFSLFTLGLCLQVLFEKVLYKIRSSRIKFILQGMICIVILFFGVWDQTTLSNKPLYEEISKEYREEERFIKEIERSIDKTGGKVFQLPYIPFPENPPVYKMTDYQHFIGYLHSNTLKWSYGAIKGRDTAKWIEEISRHPPEEMINYLCNEGGYEGIYIDLDGYPDNGTKIKGEFTNILRTEPIIGVLGTKAFFNIREYTNKVNAKNTDEHKDKVNTLILNRVYKYELAKEIPFTEDLFFIEGWAGKEETHRWSIGYKSYLKFSIENFNTNVEYQVILKIKMTNRSQTVFPYINGVDLKKMKVSGENTLIIPFSGELLKDGEENVLSFSLPDAKRPNNGDTRILGIALESFSIEEK